MNADISANSPPPATPEELALRTRLPHVTRLSRKLIATLGVISVAALAGVLIYALHGKDKLTAPADKFEETHALPPQELAKLPKDYTQIPKLGPPLPGDFGRPMLKTEAGSPQFAAVPTPHPADPAAAQRRQQAAQEHAAARASGLFIKANGDVVGMGAAPLDTSAPLASNAPSHEGTPAAPDAKDRKLAFLQAGDSGANRHLAMTAPPAGPILQAGTLIPAALLTGIRSDLPGQVIAVVTEVVHDSVSGQIALIPQGAKLIGTYDSRIDAGQRRVLLVWERLILPDGRSLLLGKLPATDAQGFAGLEDGVDYHWTGLAKAAGLSTLLNLGLELGSSSDSDIARAIRDSTRDTIGRTGEAIVRRELTVPPTLTIKPGFRLRVMVTKDLALPAWESMQ